MRELCGAYKSDFEKVKKYFLRIIALENMVNFVFLLLHVEISNIIFTFALHERSN